MSNLSNSEGTPLSAEPGTCFELLDAREALVGENLTIRRALPLKGRRMVGPWCFLDHFGPADFKEREHGMWVGQHPHIGLQTVTWLLDGEVLHRDSLGTEQVILPGSLNIMTSGRGISHTEESPQDHTGRLHGVQLWVALPDAARNMAPTFEHHSDLPVYGEGAVQMTLVTGSAGGHASPATTYSPMMSGDIQIGAKGTHTIELDAAFEHGILLLEGDASIEGTPLAIGKFAYLEPGRRGVEIRTVGPARLFIVGGVPFDEQILLWWNFVGRTPEEIEKALGDWKTDEDRFGQVRGFEGQRLVAPELPRLSPPGRR